jgi:NAD(P)-dependent dehydrogenase (short-subunit alcohol dehydrogenase family)
VDKVVIVTGGGKGIGRAIAASFVAAGARVVIPDVDVASMQRTVDELRQKGGKVLGIETDVRDEDQVRAMIARTVDEFGRVDVLINNAAIVSHSHVWPSPVWGEPWPLVRDMSYDFWRRVIETSIHGTFLCCKYAIPAMEAVGGGHIMTIPGGGRPEKLGVLAYAMAKQTTTAFVRYLAEEVRESNICVLAVNPGATIATEDAPEEVKQQYPGVEVIGNRYVLAAEAPMEMSGKSVRLVDGRLEATG